MIETVMTAQMPVGLPIKIKKSRKYLTGEYFLLFFMHIRSMPDKDIPA